jgi:hypothetical protein
VTVKSTLIGEGVEDLVRELRILLEKARILRENDLDSEGVSDGEIRTLKVTKTEKDCRCQLVPWQRVLHVSWTCSPPWKTR